VSNNAPGQHYQVVWLEESLPTTLCAAAPHRCSSCELGQVRLANLVQARPKLTGVQAAAAAAAAA